MNSATSFLPSAVCPQVALSCLFQLTASTSVSVRCFLVFPGLKKVCCRAPTMKVYNAMFGMEVLGFRSRFRQACERNRGVRPLRYEVFRNAMTVIRSSLSKSRWEELERRNKEFGSS